MIPIFSILGAFISAANFICFFRLHLSYRRTKFELVEKFSKIFLSFGLCWFFLSLPLTLVNDLKLIQVCVDLGLFFGYLAIIYSFLILFKISYYRSLPKSLLFIMVGLGIIFLIFNILNVRPAFIHFQNNFVFWSENRSHLANIIAGLMIILSGIYVATFFYLKGLKIKEKEVRFRAFLIAISVMCLVLGTVVRFLLLRNIFISLLISFFFGIFSVVLMITAVFFVKPKAKNKQGEKIMEKGSKTWELDRTFW